MNNKSSLHIASVQSNTKWLDVKANLKHLTQLMQQVSKQVDVIVLPETFNTGFVMDSSFAELMGGQTVSWMKTQSQLLNVVVCGSLFIKEGQEVFNRFIWIEPNGTLHHYDKRHLFSLAGEEQFFTQGNQKCLISYRGWNIRPLICYDLRFPVWSRNNDDTDLLIYVANWPERRVYAWNQLLIARAIENQCFVIGVNRCGNDANKVQYPGQSVIVDAMGEPIIKAQEKEGIIESVLHKESLEKIRSKIDFQKDRDIFTIP